MIYKVPKSQKESGRIFSLLVSYCSLHLLQIKIYCLSEEQLLGEHGYLVV